jgi:WhiB family redox-sensing transcriptional regulator
MSWKARAICQGTDPSLWFPSRGEQTKYAISICCKCPVATECLEYALTNGIKFGIWGGVSERGRRRMRQARASAQAQRYLETA